MGNGSKKFKTEKLQEPLSERITSLRTRPIEKKIRRGSWDSYFHHESCKDELGIPHSEFTAAMAEGGSVEVEIVKVVTLGPPEAGKTQLKRALTGNLEESTESTPLSTGAEVIMERFFDGGVKWEALCTSELQKALYNTIQGRTYNPESPQSSVDASVFQSTQSPKPKRQTSRPHESTDVCDLKSSTAGKDILLSEFTKLKERVLVNFSRSHGNRHLNKVRFIHFIDSGGQPAFFDVHPVIATSRAVYLIVYNSAEGLLECPKITYRKPKDFPTRVLSNSYQTNLDMIKRSLFTLHHCKDKFLKMEDRLKRCLGAENVSFSSNKHLQVLMVGTRKSQSHHIHPNPKLMSCFSSNPSLRSGIWEDARFVESSDPSCQGIEDLRQIISESMCKFKIHFPLKWFYCQLIFWSANDPAFAVMRFCDLKDLCIQEGIVSNDDMFLALLITFHMLGIFSCPDLDDANFDEEHLRHSPVFTKPDVLYQQVSTLLEIPFRDLQAPQAKSMHELGDLRDIQKSGIITQDSLTLLGIPDTLGSFTGFHSYLLKYLVGWGLGADISTLSGSLNQDGVKSKQLFIPSVLPPREKRDFCPKAANSPIPSFALSMCDKKSEEYYVPQGLFPHFVVSLMHLSQRGYAVKVGDADSYPRCRDVIAISKQAQMGTQLPYTVYVVDNLDHVTVHTNPAQTNEGAPSWLPPDCCLILEDLQNAMAEAYARLYQQTKQPSVILGYECPCPLAKKRGTHLARLDCARDVPVIHCLSSGHEGIWETTCTGTLREILCSRREGGSSLSSSTQRFSESDVTFEPAKSHDHQEIKTNTTPYNPVQGHSSGAFCSSTPSDIGLHKVAMKICSCDLLAVDLGISLAHIDSIPDGPLKGLRTLAYWRDGKCDSSFPTTWSFLLEKVEGVCGRTVAEELKKTLSKDPACVLKNQ